MRPLLPLAILALLLPASAQAFSVKSLDLQVKDLVYNKADGLLYVSVPGSVPVRGNTVTLIDPASGSIVGSIPAGSEPNVLALSQDGSTLYVGLSGASLVKRIDTKSRSVTLDIPLPNGDFGPTFAEDISVQPGHPNTIAVSLMFTSVSPRHAGVAVFDDATQRPNMTQRHTGSNLITFGDRDDRLYGANTESSEAGYRRYDVNANGLTELSVTTDLIGGWRDFEWFSGRIYSSGGRVIEPETAAVLGSFTFDFDEYDRTIAPDTSVTYFVAGGNGLSLKRYDTKTFAQLSTRQLPSFQQPAGLVRWGPHGLAFFTFDFFSSDTKVFILDGIDDAPDADLTVSAFLTPNPPYANAYFNYDVVIRNLGPENAEDVQLASTFTNYQPGSVLPSRGTCPAGQPCQFGTLVPGDSVTVRYAFYPSGPGTLGFHSVATTATGDPDKGNNETVGSVEVVPLPDLPDLHVEVDVDQPGVVVGHPVHVRVTVSNRGGAAATHSRLEYQLNGSDLRVDGIDNPRGTCTADSIPLSVCTLGSLAPGDSVTVTYTLTAQSYGYIGGYFQAASDGSEQNPFDNYGSFYLTVLPSSDALVDSLYARVRQLSLKTGASKSLLRPLQNSSDAFAAGDDAGGCAGLRDFEDALNKQVGKTVTIPVAYSLLAQSTAIRQFAGCDASLGRHFTPPANTHASAPIQNSFRIENNPSGGPARLSFALAQAGRARIRVFDVRGRLVTTLGDQPYEAGPHQLTWEAPPAPGVYFYRFEIDGAKAITARGVIVPQ